MEFFIKNKDGQRVFFTEYESCIPLENLDSMSNAGMTFYLNSKKVSIAALRTQFKDVKPVKPAEVVDDKDQVSTSEVGDLPSEDDFTTESTLDTDTLQLDFPVTSRTIICLNNNKIYRNQKEAAEDLQIDINWVSYSVTQKREYKGYTFKKVVDLH